MELIILIIIGYILVKVFRGKEKDTPTPKYNAKPHKPANSQYHNRPSITSRYPPRTLDLINEETSVYQRRINENHRFQHIYNISGFQVLAYTTYYPVRYKNAHTSVQNDRSLVYNFKEGRGVSDVVNIISNCLLNHKKNRPFEPNTMLSIIPASNRGANNIRFQRFCHDLSQKLQIENGFLTIQRVQDRASMMVSGHNIDRLDGLEFNARLINNKRIILFDDVITKGDSFLETAQKLKQNGALNVVGVFIAKTYSERSDSEPSWMAR